MHPLCGYELESLYIVSAIQAPRRLNAIAKSTGDASSTEAIERDRITN